MRTQRQHVVVRREPYQDARHQRAICEVEWRSAVRQRHALPLLISFGFRQVTEIDHAHHTAHLIHKLRARIAVRFADQRPQCFMPQRHRINGPRHCVDIDYAAQPQREKDVVMRVAAVHLIEEPETLLRV